MVTEKAESKPKRELQRDAHGHFAAKATVLARGQAAGRTRAKSRIPAPAPVKTTPAQDQELPREIEIEFDDRPAPAPVVQLLTAAMVKEQLKRLKKEEKERKEIEKLRAQIPPNAFIVDPDNGWYLDFIDPSLVTNPTGRKWRHDKHSVYSLQIVRRLTPATNGNELPIVVETIEPLEPPEKVEVLPEKGYSALHWPTAEIYNI